MFIGHLSPPLYIPLWAVTVDAEQFLCRRLQPDSTPPLAQKDSRTQIFIFN
jgi:hypothetical protein